ncbi:hypothetical protein ES705_37832 [subsurface metagenome]
MAKLKAPLLSLGASGAIGKTIVYFGWKGLDCAREYVVPSNPKTEPQNTQRGYVIAAVAAIHDAQVAVASPLIEVDKSAYALYGTTFPTPRTWFNQVIQRWLLAEVNGEVAAIYAAGAFEDVGAGATTITIFNHQTADQAGFMVCGTSKTAMLKAVAADGVASEQIGVFTGLTKGVKYFFQFRPTKVSDDKYVARSGIYYHVQVD